MPLTGDKFDQVGALARCVADLSLFDTAVTGDSGQVIAPSLKGVRIGISPEYFWSGLDPEVERVSNEARFGNSAKRGQRL
jgi:Asp-tRNA(Asn)/Glu-tRNA(Gln) amidotransferase A subunit family amidase